MTTKLSIAALAAAAVMAGAAAPIASAADTRFTAPFTIEEFDLTKTYAKLDATGGDEPPDGGSLGLSDRDVDFVKWVWRCSKHLREIGRNRGNPQHDRNLDRVRYALAKLYFGSWLDRFQGCGWGDPHNVTFSGLSYDFMMVGEFLYTKIAGESEADTFQAQARLKPYGASGNISAIGAVAVQTGAAIVEFYAADEFPLRVNGQGINVVNSLKKMTVVFGSDHKFLCAIVREDPSFYVFDRNLNTVELDKWSNNVDLYVSIVRRNIGEVTGLLGDPSKGLLSVNGEPLPSVVTLPNFKEFARGWCLSTENSLFTNGQRVEFDAAFPSVYLEVDSIPSDVRKTLEDKAKAAFGTGATDYDIKNTVYDLYFGGDSFLAADCFRLRPEPLSSLVVTSTAEKDVKVVNLITGELGDKSYWDSADRGMKMVVADYPNVKLNTVVSGSDESKWQAALEEAAAKQDYDVFVLGSYQMAQYLQVVAPKYPGKKFIIYDVSMDYSKSDCGNVYSITFKQNEGSYLAGYYAGLMSKSSSVGLIGGEDNPVVNDFIAGYKQGAAAAGIAVGKLLVQYATGWDDPAKGREIALAMYQQGVDIIFQVAGGTGLGVFQAAQETKNYAIGVDSDQATIIQDTNPEQAKLILTSMVKNIDNSLYRAMKMYMEGTLKFGSVEALGLKEDGVELAKNSIYDAATPAGVKTKIDQAEKDILSGKIVVDTVFK